MSPEDVTSEVVQPKGPVVVLGGAGFIGTRLSNLLAAQNIPFRIGDLRMSAQYPEHTTICDVRDASSLTEVLSGARGVINLAAEHRDNVRPISRYHDTNVEGARQVCEAATAAGIDSITFTSSVAVYGFHRRPIDEGGPFEPFHPYGQTKLEAEGVYRGWAEQNSRRRLVVIRPTVVFGEGNRGNVYNLLRQIASGKFLMVGPGTNVKSMAYVGNIVALLYRCQTLGCGQHTFNYVDGPDLNTKDLVTYVWSCLGRKGRVPHLPLSLAMGVGHTLDAISRVTGKNFPVTALRVKKFTESTQFRSNCISSLDFTPPYTLKEALARTIQSEFGAK
ncbi:MAG: NAD-dependent epimerase/dehydratase family protein [Terracidiphilus sp.]|nr:NAD-dependent epimerase/dehydratase family protein [Terracidiphilus sp.]